MFEFESAVSVSYGETTDLVAGSAKNFSEQFIRPHVMEWDESE